MSTTPTPLSQECADFATSLRSAFQVAKLQGKTPESFLRAADLLERASAALTQGAGAVEPVATVISWTNSSYSRNYKLTWHKDVPEGTKLHTAQQLQQAVARAPYLQPDDMAALERLDECFEDGQEYDVSKPAMQRLAELGAVRHHSAGRYSITTFGRIVLGNHLYRFPLETLDECNDRLGREAAAIRAKGTHD